MIMLKKDVFPCFVGTCSKIDHLFICLASLCVNIHWNVIRNYLLRYLGGTHFLAPFSSWKRNL